MSSPEVPGPEPPRAGAASAPPLAQRMAEWDGCDVALEVAIACGVGLVREGARAALRSFVVNTLSTRPGQVMFVVPGVDLVDLLELDVGGSASQISQGPSLPCGLMVTASVDAALDVLEGEALMRALVHPRHDRIRWTPTLVLMATTMFRHQVTRLETVLDLGSGYGVAAILAGYWREGSTVSVQSNGQVSAPGPGLGRVMHQQWMGTMDAVSAVEQLTRIARREIGHPAPPGSPVQ
jgi:hypothetical protein